MATYAKPDFFTKKVFNPMLAVAIWLGFGVRGSRILAVPGRKSGQIRTNPVNLLNLDGARYLVAPRGNTEWSRNVRAAGGGELRLGRKKEPFKVQELADGDKTAVLRAYLKLWSFETGKWFDGVTADSPDEDVRRIAADHPVFKIV
jgi:deazaflavin-dependent oxidoreductase (nitroreductase family)